MTSKTNQQNPFEDAPIIFSYSRQQAIDDGVLVDLTSWARETGFRIPVACTHAVWTEYIEPSDDTAEMGQSQRGRAHDVLWMLYLAIKRSVPGQPALRYEVLFLNEQLEHETVTLKAVCGPGDSGEPVMTIMQTHED